MRRSPVPFRLLVPVFLMLAAGAACRERSAIVSGEGPVPVRLEVKPDSAAGWTGDTVRMEAAALDAEGRPVEGVEVSWSSSDTAAAVVDGEGLVTFRAAGFATVTAAATSGGARITGSSSTKSRGRKVEGVDASPDMSRVSVGDTVQLDVTVTGRGGTELDRNVKWSSFDPVVAAVDGDGTVSARSAGSTRIEARSGGVRDTVAVEVTDDGASSNTSGPGLWVGAERLASLPTSGGAWESLVAEAEGSCGTPDLSDQDQDTNVCVMAKALVFARTGEERYRADVVGALESVAGSGTYDGRALALGRELAAYVIAADLVDLVSYDGSLDEAFRRKLRELRTTPTHSGPDDLVDCHERRPNNWGTHCGASRAAVAAYLGDEAELDRVARVFRGWLGDRSAYAGFSYGDLSWQCDPDRPVGVNPAGCTKEGHPIGGVLPDDQRREGGFTWPPPKANYVWGGLQGALAQAVILHRQGYDVFQWEDRALLRAVRWLHQQADYPAEGDDAWQPHLINHFYGTDFPAPVPADPGKNAGWTDWTHGG